MKTHRDSGRRLEEALSRAEPYIEDRGFTDRVLERLPARQTRPRRAPLILGAAALGMVAFVFLPPGAWLGRAMVLLLSRQPAPLSLIVAVAAVLAALLWSSLVAARSD